MNEINDLKTSPRLATQSFYMYCIAKLAVSNIKHTKQVRFNFPLGFKSDNEEVKPVSSVTFTPLR